MIDLTPLDVRNKKGDFAKALRGYDAHEVDTFLDLVAERLEALVRENMTLRERSDRLLERVSSQEGREKAVQEALVTAQELREEVQVQAQKQADLIRKEAEGEARRIVLDAEREVKERRDALEELERKRLRFLRAFRSLLERELDVVEVEEGRAPLEDVEVELDLGGGRRPSSTATHREAEPTEPEDREAAESDTPAATAAAETDESPAAAGSAEPSAHDEEERPSPDAPVHELAEASAAAEEEDHAEDGAEDDDLWLSAVLQDDEPEGRTP